MQRLGFAIRANILAGVGSTGNGLGLDSVRDPVSWANPIWQA
jgi:hypothetical protein